MKIFRQIDVACSQIIFYSLIRPCSRSKLCTLYRLSLSKISCIELRHHTPTLPVQTTSIILFRDHMIIIIYED